MSRVVGTHRLPKWFLDEVDGVGIMYRRAAPCYEVMLFIGKKSFVGVGDSIIHAAKNARKIRDEAKKQRPGRRRAHA